MCPGGRITMLYVGVFTPPGVKSWEIWEVYEQDMCWGWMGVSVQSSLIICKYSLCTLQQLLVPG